MKPSDIILIIQSMQLPIVVLIFLFTINLAVTNETNHEKFQLTEKLKGLINGKNPLVFIAIGFLFNLTYLLFNVGSEFQFSIFQVERAIFLFNILTTYFFFLQSLQPLSQIFTASHSNNESENLNLKKIISWKGLAYLIITLSMIVIFYNLEEDNPIFSFINFVSYLCVSIYLFKLFSFHRDSLQSNKTRNIIFAGWIIWTSLQLLRPASKWFILDLETVKITGFSVSLLAKCLILYGLNDFSIRTARYANEQLKRANIQLDSANIKLLDKNQQLEQKIASVNSLPDLINSVSNSKNLVELAKMTVNHLTNKEVFDFDYAIFSEVDYLKQRIIYTDAITVNNNIGQPEKWVRNEGFSLDHHDIMAQLVRDGRIIHAKGERLNGEPIDINSEKSPLDRETYIKYNHSNLNRFYIPLKNLKDNKGENKVVAVIEIGYYIKDIDPSAKTHKTKPEIEKSGELDIYIDNCAHTYERLFNQDVDKKTDSLLRRCDRASKDNHLTYLQEILTETCRLINVEFGFINLFSINKTFWCADSVSENNKIDDHKKSQIENILTQYLEKSANFNDAQVMDEKELEEELFNFLSFKSAWVKKVCFQNSTTGYFCLFSENDSHFNEVINSILEKIVENIGATYGEKKFHNAVFSLITPDNAITDLEVNLQPLINTLKSYFETPYTSLWLKEIEDNKERYRQVFASSELIARCKKFGENVLPISKMNLEYDYKLIELDSVDTDIENISFKKFGQKNNVKMLLRKPLKAQHQFFGFINIYFNRNIDDLVYEDKNFLNLIAVKALITIQIHNLVNAFREISDSFTQNHLNETLQKITDHAMFLLNADPVILFKSNNGEQVFFKDVTYSNKEDFYDDKILQLFQAEKDSPVELAEHIIKDDSQFFNDKNEYREYIRKHSKVHKKVHFEKDFWDREKIQSVAAIRLVHKANDYIKPVGVMFINFRNKVDFNDETIRLIKTFASFAAGSIYNGLVFEQNRQFIFNTLRISKPLFTELTNAGTLHDAKKIFDAIHRYYKGLISQNDDHFAHKKLDKFTLLGNLKKLEQPFNDLSKMFSYIENLYKPNEEPDIKKVNIARLLENQVDIMEAQLRLKLIKVIREFESQEIFAECDESQIGFAILNILKNAYEAMDKRGTLKLRLNKVERTNEVKIEIIDDGKGISDEIKDLIFEPYFSYDKAGGSGLGLPMSKFIIETNHLGHIRGVTRNGKTTFTIILPVNHPDTLN